MSNSTWHALFVTIWTKSQTQRWWLLTFSHSGLKSSAHRTSPHSQTLWRSHRSSYCPFYWSGAGRQKQTTVLSAPEGSSSCWTAVRFTVTASTLTGSCSPPPTLLRDRKSPLYSRMPPLSASPWPEPGRSATAAVQLLCSILLVSTMSRCSRYRLRTNLSYLYSTPA